MREFPVLLQILFAEVRDWETFQPAQSDYFQSVKGGGHGDYRLVVLAPSSVQEMSDFVPLAYDLSFDYRIPVLIVSDGLIGQMMEKVELFDPIPRLTDEEVAEKYPWATNGKPKGQERRVITSLDLDPHRLEEHNFKLQKKYADLQEKEVRVEMIDCEDADYIIVAYGSSARIAQKSIQLARKEGIKVGLLRPITLWPFPKKEIDDFVNKGVKGFLSVEMSAGQMVEDVHLVVNGRTKVEHFGTLWRSGSFTGGSCGCAQKSNNRRIDHGNINRTRYY